MKRFAWLVLVVLVIAAGAYLYEKNPKQTTPTATQKVVDQQSAEPLKEDLSYVKKPYFVNTVSLSSGEKKLQSDVQMILYPDPQSEQHISLIAIGKRYIVVEIPGPEGSSPYVFDSITLQKNYLGSISLFRYNSTTVYTTATDICTYTLDQASCLPIANAKLSNGEVYFDDQAGGGNPVLSQSITHTNSTITVPVYKWINLKLKQVRVATYLLP